MNWIDAVDHAHLDAATGIPRAAKAQGPEDLLTLTTEYLRHRLRGLPGGVAAAQGLARALAYPPPGTTDPAISVLDGFFRQQMDLNVHQRDLDAEGLLALVQWAVGTREDPRGFFRLFWDQVDAGVHDPAIEKLERVAELLVTTLREEDTALRDQAATLPHTFRAMFLHLGQDAAALHADRDGYTSAAVREQRRRLVRAILARRVVPTGVEAAARDANAVHRLG